MASDLNFIAIAGLGVGLFGVYQYFRQNQEKEEIRMAGDGGSSGRSISDIASNTGSTSTTTLSSNADVGDRELSASGVPNVVINDAKKITQGENAQGRNVIAEFDSQRNRTNIRDQSTGEIRYILDYEKKISTTPQLEAQRMSSGSTFQGPVRPTDNEQLFRYTGITRPSDVVSRGNFFGGLF